MNSEPGLLKDLIKICLPLTPLFLAWIAGMALSVAWWQRHPKISLLAFLGFAGLLVSLFGNIVLNLWVSKAMFRNGWSSAQMETFYTVKSVITGLFEAGLTAMLIYAIFGLRRVQARPASGNDPRAAGTAA
jgi:hypothetical protein